MRHGEQRGALEGAESDNRLVVSRPERATSSLLGTLRTDGRSRSEFLSLAQPAR